MKNHFFFILLMVLSVFSCKNQTEDHNASLQVQEINALYQKLIEEGGDARKNPALSKQIVQLSSDLLENHPNHEQTAKIVFTAAEVARGLQQYATALHYWKKVIQQFPNSPFAEKSLFLSAFCYDADLNDKENAAKEYEEYLSLFPEGSAAEEAKILLQMLNTPESDLIEMLQNALPAH
jgi:tetratricopeptide (TPR) repeat protein